nr:sigma-70 family RNA polymerase sigma factor [uncultured Mucilaginibacter sp.]
MDEKQFLKLVSEHQGIIHKICRLYRDTAADREDLFQEIVFQLWRGVNTFRGDAKPSTWIYRVALNTAIATFRKRKPEIEYTLQLPDVLQEDESDELALRREQLFRAIKQLNDGEKAIVALYLDDMDHRQIAEITGITENNVAVKLNRIKTKIQKLLNI